MSNYNYNYILLTVDKPDYRYEFQSNNPMILGDYPEIGLKSLFLWYTYPNVSEKYDNNSITLSRNGVEKEVKIPKGMYEVSALGDFINSHLQTEDEALRNSKVFALLVNESTFKSVVKIMTNSDIKVDFSRGTLHKLLGLEAKVYTAGSEEGTGIINITRGVNKVYIRCSLVDRVYQHKFNDILYDVLPYSEPGAAIQEHMDVVEFHKCKDQFVKHLDIRITDGDGKLLDFTEPISLKLVFRSRETISFKTNV